MACESSDNPPDRAAAQFAALAGAGGPGGPHSRLHVCLFEDIRVFGINEVIDCLLEDGLFAIVADHNFVGRLARAETGNLAALRDLASRAVLVGVHFFRFNFNHQFGFVVVFNSLIDFQFTSP